MSRRYFVIPCMLPVIAGIALAGDDALACGACFNRPMPPPPPPPPPMPMVVAPPPPPPPEVDTVVTGHRMAFSISTTQSVLWDQIRYSGNPSEFAWVLPVRSGARIEMSQDAWIAALEASTETVVQGPAPVNCGGPTYGGGGISDYGGGSSHGGCFGSSDNE